VTTLLRRAGGRIALTCGRIALALEAPRGHGGRPLPERAAVPFEIHTFVTDEVMYSEMRRIFIESGFDARYFVRLTDRETDPYAAISRIGSGAARYPILCHQDVRPDHGAGARELLAALEHLDAIDGAWVVAGNAGITRKMRIVRRLRDPHGGSTAEPLPVPVVTLDENFLVFNARNPPCSTSSLHGFHLYGTDVCLHALKRGGSAYVIDFPLSHLSRGRLDDGYHQARDLFVAAWNRNCLFRYIATPSGVLFLSRSRFLSRLFGSPRILSWAWASLVSAGDPWWLRES
jgi:hypothetical protein